MSAYTIKKISSPLPLSCLIHFIAFLVLGIAGSVGNLPDVVPMDTVIELETAQEEITPEEALKLAKEQPAATSEYSYEEINNGDIVENGLPPVAESKSMLSVVEQVAAVVGAESTVASVEKAVAQAAGEQAILSEKEAVNAGDGVIAAGNGNTLAVTGGGSSTTGFKGLDSGLAKTSNGTAGTVATSPTGGSATDAGDIPGESITSITDRFADRVEQNKKYPHIAMKRNQQGVVRVYAIISADGQLMESGVASSSGVDSLDKAAVQAVKRSCPFEHNAGHTVNITVPIHFTLT